MFPKNIEGFVKHCDVFWTTHQGGATSPVHRLAVIDAD
jgi:hypothetical protein